MKEIESESYDAILCPSVLEHIKSADKAIKEMESGDLLALLGKGRENFQDIKGEKIPYSDFNIIQNYL